MSQNSKNLLICCTGSVATTRCIPLVSSIKEKFPSTNIAVVLTENAKHFVDIEELKSKYSVEVYDDNRQWSLFKETGEVLHIKLKKWADVMVIAPLNANTLAKIVGGICDNLLTSVVRGWKIPTDNSIVCPAMNTLMWEHPITSQQMLQLEAWGFFVIPPITKALPCGDVGIGAMCEVGEIVNKLSSDFFNN